MHVVLATTPDELEAHAGAWDELAGAALEPNVFQEPWVLLPAWRAFGGAHVQALLAYEGERLDGVFVLARLPRFFRLPIPRLRSWMHQYGPLGTPLVRANNAAACVTALFDWLSRDRHGAPVLELVDYGADGPFRRCLLACARQRRLARFDTQVYDRAVLRHRHRDRPVAAAMSSSSRRELGRQHRRLEEAGHLELRSLDGSADPWPWISAFLDVERAGWKGRAQTALASDSTHRAFFEHIAREAHRRGRLRMLGLFLDDRPIAMKCNLVAGPGAFAWKIAFDEQFSSFSPGVQLELDTLPAFEKDSDTDWIDSCTSEGPTMIDRVWTGRRAIAVTAFSTGRTMGTLAVSALEPLRRIYRTFSPQGARRSAPSSPAAAGIGPAAQPDPAGRP